MSNDENDQEIGSSPSRGTIFTQQISESLVQQTESARRLAEPESLKVKFPQVIRHRKVGATIYVKSPQLTAISIGLLRGGPAPPPLVYHL